MKVETQDVKAIYSRLQDDLSRTIFENRLMYNITGDGQYLKVILDATVLPEIQRMLDALREQEKRERFLFGAGFEGQAFYSVLQCYGETNWNGFVDTYKSGQVYCGLPVISFAELSQSHRDAYVVIVSHDWRREMEAQLLAAGFSSDHLFNGGELVAFLRERQYFDLPALPHTESEFFVDAGAFDGLTTEAFCRWAGDDYKCAWLFEPNVSQHEICKRHLAKRHDIKIVGKGLWSHSGTLAFRSDGAAGASLVLPEDAVNDKTLVSVPVTSLDEALGDVRPTFIKFDIEGAEKEALIGAEYTIRNNRPKMAVCIYHKMEDIWELPKLLLDYQPDYRFYLRHYAIGAHETVLYAI